MPPNEKLPADYVAAPEDGDVLPFPLVQYQSYWKDN